MRKSIEELKIFNEYLLRSVSLRPSEKLEQLTKHFRNCWMPGCHLWWNTLNTESVHVPKIISYDETDVDWVCANCSQLSVIHINYIKY